MAAHREGHDDDDLQAGLHKSRTVILGDIYAYSGQQDSTNNKDAGALVFGPLPGDSTADPRPGLEHKLPRPEEHPDKDNEANILSEFQQEPRLYKGVFSTVEYLKDRGEPLALLARKNRQDKRTIALGDVKLEYYDRFGNTLTPKQAYKELSRKFHGKRLGKAKAEKQLKSSVDQHFHKDKMAPKGNKLGSGSKDARFKVFGMQL